MSERVRTKLVGLDGQSRHPSVWHALGAYGREREGDGGLAVVLEVCARFFDITLQDLFSDVVPRPRGKGPPGAPRSWSLGAEWLLRGLGPCLALFSYQCLVGSRLIERFGREVPELARWCLAERLVDEREFERAALRLARARVTLSRHRSIQSALESAAFEGVEAPGRRSVDGRFRVEGTSRDGAVVAVPSERFRATVSVPHDIRHEYKPGTDVCLHMVEAVVGWVPLASTVPVEPSRLDREIGRWHRYLSSHGPRRAPPRAR